MEQAKKYLQSCMYFNDGQTERDQDNLSEPKSISYHTFFHGFLC